MEHKVKMRIADCGMQNEKRFRTANLKFKLAIMAFVLVLTACGMFFYHDTQKARRLANSFLNAVYVEGDFTKAYSMVDADFEKNFGPGFLEKISARFAAVFSRLEGLKADYYMYESGERSIMLLFTGISEKAPSYHKIMMTGDAQHGYKISSVVYSDIPFSGFRTLKPFK
jgi:hypothetical protein